MAGYIGTQPVPQATQTRDAFTATNNQTSFPTSGYTPEFLDVFLNGVKLAAADYTATNGSDVVLAVGATTGDILEVVSYGTFEVLNPTFDGNVTFTGNASFGDNDKAIFGDGSDLQIYHDGSNSYIDDAGTGLLAIRANTGVYLQKYTGETLATFVADGGAAIYHDNAAKLATTSTGISVTGGITTDAYSYLNGLRIAGADTGNTVYQQSGDLSISSASGSISLKPSGTNILHATNTGVGIGTSSPTLPLDIVSNPGADALKIRARPNGNDYGTLTFYNNAGTTKWADIQSNVAKDLRFYTNGGSEAMRIDSSGHVLVGKTSANNTDVGTTIYSTLGFSSTRSGGVVGILNRTTNDGDIMQFRKSGSTVGSIGSLGSAYLYIGSTGGTDTFASFHNGGFRPATNTGVDNDNALNLGGANGRWKDLYLSGGVYLGGTGSANKLEDYEEGTWTPQLNFDGSNNGITYTSRVGRYTKIGRMVYASFLIVLSNKGSATGGTTISGLPFNHFVGSQHSAANLTFENNGVSANQIGAYAMPWADGNLYLRYQGSTGYLAYTNANFNNSTKIFGMATYETTP